MITSSKKISTHFHSSEFKCQHCGRINPPTEIVALYCTSYGSIITYFFTKKTDEKKGE